jgi:cyclic dehypoxanthinyl futalosine synthase
MAISPDQALDCFLSDDLIGIGMEADAVRRRLHPEGVVTYVIDRKILLNDPAGVRSFETISEEIQDTVELGGTGIHLVCAALGRIIEIEQLASLVRRVKQQFPSIWVQGLTASDICAIAANSALPVRDTIARLHHAGLDSIAGTDALILDDDFRRTPICTTQQWLDLHRAAHRLGIGTTAGMTIGLGETAAQRVRHLELLRQLQGETGGFTAFIPTCFQPADRGGVHGRGEPTAIEYLKTLAISRMVLDTIPNLQSSWAPHGLKVLQTALRFGTNDAGSVLPEPIALATPGSPSKSAPSRATEEDLRRIIRDAGFHPIQRDTPYRTLFLN